VRTGRRALATVLCLVLAVQGLAGCAETTQGQGKGVTATVGAATGAAAGAIVGLVAGGKKGAAIGAAAGAVIGGLVGWQVGQYQARQVRDGATAAKDNKYTPAQGVVAKIDRSTATPQQLRPGDEITLQASYTVLAPPERAQVKVKETRTIFFNGQELGRLERESEVAAGSYATEQALAVPPDAAEGRYLVQTVVEPVAVEKPTIARANSDFVVGITASAAGVRATPARGTPQTGGPSTSALPRSVLPQTVYVKLSTANLREGAGTTFKIIGSAARGARLAVLGEGGSANDRWFRVKLDDGREAWIASSVVSIDPP
jgi:Bacterial SH3 domain/YMGG-like Gly-zipper